MDVWQITVAALRRWYVLLPLLALTAFGALRVGEGIHPQYEVRATAILVPGTTTSEIESPYGNRNETNQVLAIVLEASEARESIAAQGLNPAYEINVRDRSNILNLEVLSDSEQESLDTAHAVLDLAQQELDDRQDAAGIPTDAQIGLQVLQAPAVSDVVAEGKMRNMAIVGIVGAAMSLLVAVLFDDLVGLFKRWLRHWRERKASKHAASVSKSEGTEFDTDEPDTHVRHELASGQRGTPPKGATVEAPGSEDLEHAGRHH